MGRKLNARLAPASNGILGALLITSDTILSCDNITPFGRPVVPEVYIIVAKSCGSTLSFIVSTSCWFPWSSPLISNSFQFLQPSIVLNEYTSFK